MKTYVVLFEVETPPRVRAHDLASKIRSALERHGIIPSGIDVEVKADGGDELRKQYVQSTTEAQ